MIKQIKILMVDDEKRFRDTTQKILSKKGFETILAESGEDALEKMAQNPDIVILDIKMPGMDGHETLSQIKKIQPDLPVIMLTGHGDKPSARQALVEGAFDYLSKPCDIDLLAEKIKEACWPKSTAYFFIDPSEGILGNFFSWRGSILAGRSLFLAQTSISPLDRIFFDATIPW